MGVMQGLAEPFRERPRVVLVGLLAATHLALVVGVGTALSRTCWLVAVGLFLIWQPFARLERRLDGASLASIGLMIGGGLWLYGHWLLMLWVTMLAALLGGRVLSPIHWPTRVFHQLAFAYLLCALLVWLVPDMASAHDSAASPLDVLFIYAAPAVFLVMLLISRAGEKRLPGDGLMIDFFYSLLIFLLIAVLVLGSLAFMHFRQIIYAEALFKTLLSIAAILLLIAWMSNPRSQFYGLGLLFSRYLLTVALPFESWLRQLMRAADRHHAPREFLREACVSLLDLPAVAGGRWSADEESERFGGEGPFRQEFPGAPLSIDLYLRHRLSPALLWHFRLLVRLINEYYLAKRRAETLQKMSYLQAVHETGARLTHDVKNLLQALDALCFAAQSEHDVEGARALIRRQLPQITQRLEQALAKLRAPQAAAAAPPAAARDWWRAAQLRHAEGDVRFLAIEPEAGATVPAALFDSALENLLQNARVKRQSEGFSTLEVRFAADGSRLAVRDSGSAVRASIVKDLLRAPVPSDNGLGIGLYHLAQDAAACGYRLRLAENREGEVCFALERETARAVEAERLD